MSSRPLSLFPLVAFLALAACNGDDPTATDTPTPATEQPATEQPATEQPAPEQVPDVVFTSPSNGTSVEQAALTVSAEIVRADAAGVRWLLNGASVQEDNGPFAVGATVSAELTLESGNNVVRLEVFAPSGAEDAAELVVLLDAPTAPVISLLAPAVDAEVDASTVRLQGDVFAEAEPTRAELDVDGVVQDLTLSDEGGGIWRFDVDVPLDFGSTALTVEIEDAAGQVATVTRTVTRVVDEAPPVLEGVWPTEGHAVHATRQAVRGTVTDNDLVASVEIEQNGVRTPATLAPDGSFLGFATLGRGANSFDVVATDASGNETVLERSVWLGSRVAAGGSHSGWIHPDGLVMWGRNNLGQVGVGYVSDIDHPDPVHPDVPTSIGFVGTAVSLVGYQNTSVLLDDTGAVWGWGDNGDGQLGQGTLATDDPYDDVDLYVPTLIPGIADAVTITGGYDHTLVLLADGTLMALGDNGAGQLGDGSTTDRDTAVAVQGITDVVQIAAASSSSFAVTSSGDLWTWGANDYAQLGTGGEDDDAHPVPAVVSGLPPIVQVAAGRDHVLALDEDGYVWGWGLNASTQVAGPANSLGDSPILTPSRLDHLGLAVAVYANGNQSYLETPDALLWGWGQNGSTGALGVTLSGDLEAPIAPVFGLVDVVDFSVGALHSIALRNDDNAFAWGWSFQGSLGAGESVIHAWGYRIPILVTPPTP